MISEKIKELAEEFENTKSMLITYLGTEYGDNIQRLKQILYQMDKPGELVNIYSTKLDKVKQARQVEQMIDEIKKLATQLEEKVKNLQAEYKSEEENRQKTLKQLQLLKKIKQFRLQRETLQAEVFSEMLQKGKKKVSDIQQAKEEQAPSIMGIQERLKMELEESQREVDKLKQELQKVEEKMKKGEKIRKELFEEETELNKRLYELKQENRMRQLMEEEKRTLKSMEGEAESSSTLGDEDHPSHPQFPLLTHKIKVKTSEWQRNKPYLIGLSLWTLLLLLFTAR